MQFSMVDMANDGTLWGLNTDGQAARYSNGGWVIDDPALTFTSLTVGSASVVWGIGTDTNLYQFSYSNLAQLDSSVSMRSISVASDGTVCGVDTAGFLRILGADGKWGAQSGDALLVSAISKNAVVGCRSADSGGVSLWSGNGWSYTNLQSSQLSAGSDGTVWVNSVLRTETYSGGEPVPSVNPMLYTGTVTTANPPSLGYFEKLMNVSLPTTLAVASQSLIWGWFDGSGIYSYDSSGSYGAGNWGALISSTYRMPGLSSDGSAFVLDATGANVLRYEGEAGWSTIPVPGTVASPPAPRGPTEVYFVTTDGNAYHWQGLFWQEVDSPPAPSSVVGIAVVDDGSVFAVEKEEGDLWLVYPSGRSNNPTSATQWQRTPAMHPLVQASATNWDSVYGRDASGKIFKLNKITMVLSAVTPDPGRPARYIAAGIDGNVHALFDSPNAGKSDIGHLVNGAWVFVETPYLTQFSVQGADEIAGVLGSTMEILTDATSSAPKTVSPETPLLVRKTGSTVFRSR